MPNETEEINKTPAQTTKQLLKLHKESAKLRRNITRIKVYIENDIQMLKVYKEEEKESS